VQKPVLPADSVLVDWFVSLVHSRSQTQAEREARRSLPAGWRRGRQQLAKRFGNDPAQAGNSVSAGIRRDGLTRNKVKIGKRSFKMAATFPKRFANFGNEK
jgi:hypothetical protein